MLPWPFIELNIWLPAFVIVLIRVSGIMITTPILGSQAIPAKGKIALVFGVSVATFPILTPMLPTQITLGQVVAGSAGELLIGLTIGVGLSFILLATQMAGMIVGQQAGIALANVFDPNTESQTSVIGTIYFWSASILFLLMGGHRAVVRCVLDSFQVIPPMEFGISDDVIKVFSELMMISLRLSLRIAGPMLMALLLVKAALGFLSRTMPQLHILSVGFAIFVSVGILLSALAMDGMYELLFAGLSDGFELIRGVLGLH